MSADEPTIELVLQYIHNLYNNPDTSEKEKASKWLSDFQNSIYSWKIADQLLQQKNDLHSCYFAAQTLRNKIQTSFHELPESAHVSLRDSLLEHILHIDNDTNPIIVTQLCLSIANLTLIMSEWQNPIEFMLEKFSTKSDSMGPFIIILTFIPEEVNSRHLRLGENRRNQVQKELENYSVSVLTYLQECLLKSVDSPKVQNDIMKCCTSWIQMNCININDLLTNAVFAYAYQLVGFPQTTPIQQMDIAADCICAVLQSINHNNNIDDVEQKLFFAIMQLENAYHDSVAMEDVDKSMNLCRVFTVMAENFLIKMVNDSTHTQTHYSIKCLDMLLNCVGHYDFEVAQITFNVWYRLSEELYQKNDTTLTKYFKPYVERLIEALYRHCQIESDHIGLLEGDCESFQEFRFKVSELIKDVVFIVTSISCFKHMFLILTTPDVTWESTESALFIMECVARNILPEENEIVPKVVGAILNLPENCHIAIRYTSINILGELCDWIDYHPDTLEAILNFLLQALKHKSKLASAAANSLQLICTNCKKHMIGHMNGLMEIARYLEMFELEQESSIALIKGISNIISRLPNDQITDAMRTLCGFQVAHLYKLLEENDPSKNDPTHWLDRLAAIYRHVEPKVAENQVHPCACVLIEHFQLISSIMEKYQYNVKIMERIIRCIRYGIRCIGKQSMPILEPLVKQMVVVYSQHKHSCLLYLGSILVDEFATDRTCVLGLLKMLEAFIEPTFKILQIEDGLKNHPDTVDDFFRLAARFIQRSPLFFLQGAVVTPIIQCAELACTLDHRDANTSVMKFLTNLLNYGRQADSSDEVKQLVNQIIQMHAETLVINLLFASIFHLHAYMLPDVADVFAEIKHNNRDKFNDVFKKALTLLPRKNSGGCVTVTDTQLNDFYDSIIKAQSSRQVTHALQDFCKLFR